MNVARLAAPLGAALLVLAIASCGQTSPSAPAPTASVDAAAVADGLRYTCGLSFAFDPAIAKVPGIAEAGQGALATALRTALGPAGIPADAGIPLPAAGWHLIGEDAGGAQFVNFANGRVTYLSFGRGPGGEWKATGWGECQPQIVLQPGLGVALWEVDPAGPSIDARTTSFTALVTERECASGQSSEGRIVGPRVLPLADRVLVVFAVRSLPGGQDCPGNPATKVKVELGEPLGDRELVDPSLLFGPN